MPGLVVDSSANDVKWPCLEDVSGGIARRNAKQVSMPNFGHAVHVFPLCKGKEFDSETTALYSGVAAPPGPATVHGPRDTVIGVPLALALAPGPCGVVPRCGCAVRGRGVAVPGPRRVRNLPAVFGLFGVIRRTAIRKLLRVRST